jgi:membrane protease YdiL (CAAX protease family)
MLRTVPGAILLGLVWFMLFMLGSIGLVLLNASVSPRVPWFPLPVLALVVAACVIAERRWAIGLTHPPGVAWGRIYFLACTTTVLGVCLAILQGAWFDMTREAELGPAGTSTQFQLAYAVVMSLVAATLAEIAFRGIMQGRLHAVLSPAAAIVLTAAVNTAAHRWGPDLAAQWFAYFVTLAGWGWVRWLGGSVLPPLAAHFGQNLALAGSSSSRRSARPRWRRP